jgi:hypothetical protein
MRYQTINNLIGWTLFAFALAVYSTTLEPSVSMWDCGEFISAANSLQVVHQPGAPFFLMVGRLFALFAPSPADVSVAINMLSALCSALTVMFTFWITTCFAARITGNESIPARIGIFTSGCVAALALTFSDTFWFSAVEAEVYAMSSFFTALTFWAALKWQQSTSPYANKWLILIAYLTGLSIGTHLLSLLVIPSIACIYYFKHFKYSRKGMAYCFMVGFAVLMFIQKIIIPGIPEWMAKTDLLFVNSLGFGFWTGALFFLAIVVSGIIYGIYYFGQRKIRPHIQLGFICMAYILLGYGSYAMVVVRSNELLPIDMSNPEEPFNLTDYINRAQYEERPLLYGPYFNAKPVDIINGGPTYRKDATQYTDIGEKRSYKYDPAYHVFFPRMGDMHKESSEIGYRYWGGMGGISDRIETLQREQQQITDLARKAEISSEIEELKSQKPTMANNLQFFFSYQVNHMYIRYFMWNFAGRQNDKQGHSHNRYMDGNWTSGITPIDNMRLGPQKDMPDYMRNNMGRNTFYFLPLALGIAGLSIQFRKKKQDSLVTGILFLFTGLLIIVFLNQPTFEPRERDYVHAGSFQVFCIWIGLGVLWLADFLKTRTKHLYAVCIASLAGLAVPALMAQQGWDDHDRSKRYLAIDFAKNILNSCPPNAIYLANADNDTYPLWYAQNVEGIRKDVRIINQNLLPTDWYSQVLLQKIYDSEPLPLSLNKEQLAAGENEYFQFEGTSKEAGAIDLATFIRQQTSKKTEVFHQKKFTVPVDRKAVIRSSAVSTADTGNIVKVMTLDFPGRGMHKGDLVLLDMIATNAAGGWKRPICFSTIAGKDGLTNLESYLERRGLVYQLVPLKSEVRGGEVSKMNIESMYDLLMNRFRFGGMRQKPGFYLDDKSDVVANSMQNLFVSLAAEYVNEAEQITFYDSALAIPGNREKVNDLKNKATRLMDKCALEIPENILPTKGSIKFTMAALRQATGHDALAKKHLQELFEICRQEVKYYCSFMGKPQNTYYMRSDVYQDIEMMKRVIEYAKKWQYGIDKTLQKQLDMLQPVVNMYLDES